MENNFKKLNKCEKENLPASLGVVAEEGAFFSPIKLFPSFGVHPLLKKYNYKSFEIDIYHNMSIKSLSLFFHPYRIEERKGDKLDGSSFDKDMITIPKDRNLQETESEVHWGFPDLFDDSENILLLSY